MWVSEAYQVYNKRGVLRENSFQAFASTKSETWRQRIGAGPRYPRGVKEASVRSEGLWQMATNK
jgi:hypothetical protein